MEVIYTGELLPVYETKMAKAQKSYWSHRGPPSYPGVYVIENIVTKDYYVGSAANLRTRKNTHFTLLRQGRHHSWKLQADWKKYGEEAFRFMSLCFSSDLPTRLAQEQALLDLSPPYNVSSKATSCQGVKRQPSTKAKIRAAVTSPERMAKFLQMVKAPRSAEHRASIALAKMGSKASEETRIKLRAAWERRRARAANSQEGK